jgi:DNA adenine methylase
MPRVAANSTEARPFVKWAGGKSQLLPDYAPLWPSLGPDAVYHEPFLGGAAVYFHLRSAGRVTGRAVLSDVNERLINTYLMARDKPEPLVRRLAELTRKHSDEEYYLERARYNTRTLTAFELAALFIYLNKAGFNGLHRVNSKGHFNVPVGRQARGPAMPTLDHFLACARALASTDLLTAPFTSVLDRARRGDFIYFDPPYMPVSPTSSFTDYATDGFGPAEQELLRDVFVQLDRRGCKVMLSNSGNLELLKLYAGYDVTTLQARRSINSKADARGPVTELVIRNYS